MSAADRYDPALLLVQRAESTSSRLGEAVLGASKLGTSDSYWVAVERATFSYSADYSPDENGTLIYGAETATVSLSFHDTLGDVLYPGDRLKCSYDGTLIFVGIVDSTSIATSFDNGVKRFDFTATVASAYAVMMSKTVSWKKLPAESALARVRRWVSVQNW